MSEYSICTDFLEIIAGTNNTVTPVYREAAKTIESDTTKSLSYLKNFITSIENIAGKSSVKDERISSSKGNIRQFSGYENIKSAMEFISKNLSGIDVMKDLIVIFNALEKYQPQYTEGYEKNVRLVVLEYENSLYLLVTGLAEVMATNMQIVQNGTQIKIQKDSRSTFGIINKTAKDLAKQLNSKNHKDYLDALIDTKKEIPVNTSRLNESGSFGFMESNISDTIDLIGSIWNNTKGIIKSGVNIVKGVKNSLFGIVPLIRSVLYLRYKKKADTILSLEQQIHFIEMNIEQLQNMKTMDPAKKAEIIKKQRATIEAYRKKAEKLRAQLVETEKEAAVEIKKEDPKIKEIDDDFILEGGITLPSSLEWLSLIAESAISSKKLPEDLQNALKSVIKKRITNTKNPIKVVHIEDIEDFFDDNTTSKVGNINESSKVKLSSSSKEILQNIIKSKTPISIDDLDDDGVSLVVQKNDKKPIKPMTITIIDESSDDNIFKIRDDVKTAEKLLKNAADHTLTADEKQELLDTIKNLHPTAKKLVYEALNKDKNK